MKSLHYQQGFGNHFATEARPGALPQGQNCPQKVAYRLYAEQLSGTAFTIARQYNLHSWLYRMHPSVLTQPFQPYSAAKWLSAMSSTAPVNPTNLRWDPLPYQKQSVDFIDGLISYAYHGDVRQRIGACAMLYTINQSMTTRFFYNADGELLIVPQEGELHIRTELGLLDVAPGEIALIPRGIKFQVQLHGTQARGYVCENYGQPFQLPELGPIGANGLANPRDFLAPTAFAEDVEKDFTLLTKFQGHFWQTPIKRSPLNVVAWHGNYTPYKYNLAHFNALNTVSFDHPDPSIFTVLTSPSALPGVANLDFVIFPPRWMVAEHTFRPPYFHRNTMSEFMGLIRGQYDAKEEGFLPFGASLHNAMSAHGPDKKAFHQASEAVLEPVYYKNTLAFMFESYYVWQPTSFALENPSLQSAYLACWHGLGDKN
ncbi:MAG: homogentisate 1,2-dioxygenase [Gammaproteobacteria bacterium]|nr:homogentisate 1,2-dioxygenase [Gammaproteobacteria bacterium]